MKKSIKNPVSISFESFEALTVSEMFNVRGGKETVRPITRDKDIFEKDRR